MYATTSAFRPPSALRTESRGAHFDHQDRVTTNPAVSNNASPPSFVGTSPTDAFFGGPSNFANHKALLKSPSHRQKKYRQAQHEAEKQQAHHCQGLSLTDLQSTQSPLTRELVDRVVAKSDSIYGDALSRLSDIHKELSSIIAETKTEDDRVLSLLEDNHRKTAKPPSDTRIGDVRTDGGILVGERVLFVKIRIDTVQNEVAHLWSQWECAQKGIDDIFAELTSDRSSEGAQTGSVASVQESLASEMAKFGEELTGILEDAHEEARASEKGFSKKINAVMSALLQQYLLED
ncbi:hypothetical protein N0V93_000937 [Gnomoniopsis smithogilvyi]|uniref:Uncharacterized protein n=1 Tax=Gnomoniopsis smithogilvyi TaxID=1191159 RepID=A0A9W8Z0P4_9PEZI|nr:hypothetical protein N0V93_000937 [Gnomoniopsis smithogilvyi]